MKSEETRESKKKSKEKGTRFKHTRTNERVR